MLLQILIPTYNRSSDLKKNLDHLFIEINNSRINDQIEIIVSDNASTDETEKILNDFCLAHANKINITYLKNNSNLGLEQNVVKLLRYSTSDYILWLGDDDYLANGYLSFVIESIRKCDIGWIVPGIIEVTSDGKTKLSRIEYFKTKNYDRGYSTVLNLSHFGHQLSGLTMRRDQIADIYLSRSELQNLYPFIFFLAYNQLKYSGIYSPEFSTRVNVSNTKDWNYNSIGLLDHIYRSYQYLSNHLTTRQLNELFLRFVLMHSYRLDFRKGMYGLFSQWKHFIQATSCDFPLRFHLLILLAKEYIYRLLQK